MQSHLAVPSSPAPHESASLARFGHVSDRFRSVEIYGSRGEALSGMRRARSDLVGEIPDWGDRHISGILSFSLPWLLT